MAYFRCISCQLKFEPHCKPCQTAPSTRCPRCGALAYPAVGQDPPHHVEPGEPAAQEAGK